MHNRHDPEIVAAKVAAINTELARIGARTIRRARDMASTLRSSPDGPSSKGTHSDPTGTLATSRRDPTIDALDNIYKALDVYLNSAYELERVMRYINAGDDAAYIESQKALRKEQEREKICEACESPTSDALRSGWCDACRKTNERWVKNDERMADRTAFHAAVVQAVVSMDISRPASPHTPTQPPRRHEHDTPDI